jgi:hypothetical protein
MQLKGQVRDDTSSWRCWNVARSRVPHYEAPWRRIKNQTRKGPFTYSSLVVAIVIVDILI